MTFHIITLFPNVIEPYLNESILKRAQKKGIFNVVLYDLREFAKGKHRQVDNAAYGGGPGMVLMLEPLVKAITKITARKTDSRRKKDMKIILLSAAGKQFDSKKAIELSKYSHVVLIAGRYEGVDERLKKVFSSPASGGPIEELSVGPYVLSGGELPAAAVVDAVARNIPGVLGKEESLEERRYGVGVPAYTRPEEFLYKKKRYRVPKELVSGNHAEIEKWRKKHRKA